MCPAITMVTAVIAMVVLATVILITDIMATPITGADTLHGKFVLPRKGSTSQILLANSGHPALVAV